jgi:hypothetical protein
LAQITHGNTTTVAISALLNATDPGPANQIGKREGRMLSTTPRLSIDIATLSTLRGIDAEETNSLSADLNGIAIDDARAANNLSISNICCETNRGEQEDEA